MYLANDIMCVVQNFLYVYIGDSSGWEWDFTSKRLEDVVSSIYNSLPVCTLGFIAIQANAYLGPQPTV